MSLEAVTASGCGQSSICMIWFTKGSVVPFPGRVKQDALWFTCKFPIRMDPISLAPILTCKRSWSWSQVQTNLLVFQEAKIGARSQILCPRNTSQPGGGRGWPLWAPSGWGTSWRTCFMSDHALCFLEWTSFVACWNGENWVSRWFWHFPTPSWIKLLDDRHTPEKPKTNANFNRVVYPFLSS